MGTQRAKRYEESIGKGKPEGKPGEGSHGAEGQAGSHTVKRPITEDKSKGPTHGMAKVPTSDPDPDAIENPHGEQSPDHQEAMSDHPGGSQWESDVRQHGMAHHIEIDHDSTGSHIRAEHSDGHVHESHHLNAQQAHDAARTLGGVMGELDEEPPNRTARDHPIGPKEDQRLRKENQGMGIQYSGEGIPGMK